MKRRYKKFAAFAIAVMMTVSLAACGASGGSSSAAETEQTGEVSGEMSGTAAAEESSDVSSMDAGSAESETEADFSGAGSAVLQFPETTEAETEETAEEETEEAEQSEDERRAIEVDFDELSEISNEAEDYGFNNSDRDELNRPNGIYYYDSKYAQYGGLTHIDTEDKIIYLTMDEGYENGCTPEILDTLKAEGVHAVFFITKQFYDENPDLIQRMIDEGHIVGNHTCAHPSGGMPQLGAEAEYEDIKKLNDLVYDKFGYQMKLFRFPEGVASKQSVALLQQMGYTSVFWSFAYHDYDTDDQMDPDEALSKCLEYIHPGAIYLLHAVSTTNTEILADFIEGARDRGYEFGRFPVDG